MRYTQNTACTQWQFTCVPKPENGVLSPVFADCGKGFDGSWCFMHTLTGVKGKNVITYIKTLLNMGCALLFENHVDDNLFFELSCSEGLCYVSYLAGSGILRVMVENGFADAESFSSEGGAERWDNTLFAQYSLHYDAMIKGTTCDCGMNYVFRLRDNSLIIIDGGEMEQSTDVALADYMDFLHRITDTRAGEPMRIALWLCTHAHNDHADFFGKMIRFHGDELPVERTAFNFPCEENTKHSPSIPTILGRIAAAYPKAQNIKLHAGLGFTLNSATVTVFTAGEDSVGTQPENIFHGLNDGSVVFCVETEGNRVTFLADMGDINANIFLKNYGEESKWSDFLQAAHHGINSIEEVYEQLDTKILLLPQCQMNMETRFPENMAHYGERYGLENVLLANNRTDIFTLKNGGYTHTTRPHVGTAYDGSEY